SALAAKGPGRVAISDIASAGPLARVVGKKMDLSGTLFVNSAVKNIALGNVVGTVSQPAVVATSGAIQTISTFNLNNARILSGQNLGADGLLGGGDDAAGQGGIKLLKVAG